MCRLSLCKKRPQHLDRECDDFLPLQFVVPIIGRRPMIESHSKAFAVVIWSVTTSNEAVTGWRRRCSVQLVDGVVAATKTTAEW